jgi:DNA-binding response OmpR family regulator
VPVVLLVDDESGQLSLFVELISRIKNCRALQAYGGAEALDILSRETPDLIILDLAMPKVSGHQVLEYIRSVPRLDRMKVMILTARPNKVAEVKELGIDYWLSKPTMPSEFIEAVRTVLKDML